MRKIGIIGAMDVEIATVKNSMKNCKTEHIAGMNFAYGTLYGKDVVVVKCGLGKVNAGICVQILADKFGVTHIINTGIAGALNNNLNILDIVISKDAVYHDMDATFFGYAPGQVPQMDVVEFSADKELTNSIMDICGSVELSGKAIFGRIASGDIFVADKTVKDEIINRFGADCVEMEGAAVAHTAYLNKLPFAVIRAISDKADGSDTMDYPVFEVKAAEYCSKIVLEIIKRI